MITAVPHPNFPAAFSRARSSVVQSFLSEISVAVTIPQRSYYPAILVINL